MSSFIFYAISLKGNFKELPEKVFSARFQLFFIEEKMTRPYHFKKFDFPKVISLQKSNFLKR